MVFTIIGPRDGVEDSENGRTGIDVGRERLKYR